MLRKAGEQLMDEKIRKLLMGFETGGKATSLQTIAGCADWLPDPWESIDEVVLVLDEMRSRGLVALLSPPNDPPSFGLTSWGMSARWEVVKKNRSEVRPLTEDEMRKRLLDHLHGIVEYWLTDDRVESLEEKADGIIFSVLTMLDGYSGAMPGFKLSPIVPPEDVDYFASLGQNWFDDGVDISGGLSSQWSRKDGDS